MSTRLPTISFLVPTHREDRPLKRCLDSIDSQLGDLDSVLVIGDVFDGPLPSVERLVKSYGEKYYYLEHNAGHHCWGHCALNYGLSKAPGDVIHISDDDDIWTPGSVDIMRSAATENPGKPILFRFLSYHGIVFWANRGEFAYERVGGHCLLAPNIPGKIGTWGEHYQGDWSYVESAVNLLGGPEQIVWRDELVVVARP